ncbi:MAG: hypothetical protein F4147_04910 [Gammaproteobacteria bacterium]|nr:hypothetical protein [Gammaproteobacteria bacterium]
MNNTKQDKPDWAIALGHHEELCVERGRTIDVRFNAVDVRFDSIEKRLDNIERLMRFTLGAILAWPPLLIAVMKLLP